jgi:hypothetical protein
MPLTRSSKNPIDSTAPTPSVKGTNSKFELQRKPMNVPRGKKDESDKISDVSANSPDASLRPDPHEETKRTTRSINHTPLKVSDTISLMKTKVENIKPLATTKVET